MNQADQQKLEKVVNAVADLMRQKKEIDDEIAEHVAEVAESLQLRKGNITKAAKEMLLTDIERADRRLREEELDQIRHALGILADTPLGEAAVSSVPDKPAKKRGRPRKASPSAAESEDDMWDNSAPMN